jgi:dGTPase
MAETYTDSDRERALPEQEETQLGRSPFRRDFGRLLHSPACRRLQGKTQLFPGHESDFFRNRLTHSLEVAQIAKGIAQLLNARDPACKPEKIDLDLVEFAGLAHDLGHPPFGHNGEKALDDCMKQDGGFEGNAQTLRILTKVEKKVFRGPADADGCGVTKSGVDRRLGLNLTWRSLAAVLKYDREIPMKRAKHDELVKGYYASEADVVAAIKQHVGAPKGKALKVIECQIMDIADDIAYSTYDLEDAMKGGFSHPMQLLARLSDKDLLDGLVAKVRKKVKNVKKKEVVTALAERLARNVLDPKSGPLEQYTQSKLTASNAKFRSQFTSEMIGDFMSGISIEASTSASLTFAKIRVDREILIQIEALKHLTYELMIMSPRLKVTEYRGYDVVGGIFQALTRDDGYLLLPDDVQQMHQRFTKRAEKRRVICDFVAGMTDRYAVEFYGRLTESGASIFKPL